MGLFLVIFENIKKIVKNACKVFFCVVIYSKPKKWRPYKTAPNRAALDKGEKMENNKKTAAEWIVAKIEEIKERTNDNAVDFAADYACSIEISRNSYIEDGITDYADGLVDLNTYDLLEWFRDNYEKVEEAIDELGLPEQNGRADILAAIRQAQFLENENEIREDGENVLRLVVLYYLRDENANKVSKMTPDNIDMAIDEAADIWTGNTSGQWGDVWDIMEKWLPELSDEDDNKDGNK